MKLCAIEPKELEEKILIRFAENQNDELLEDLSDYVINSQKEIERLNKENKILRENAEHNDKVVDKVNWENKRLNNIINELEKWLDKKEKLTFNSWNKGIHEVQRKLQELKGDGSNE